jgi:phage FluMu protein Com
MERQEVIVDTLPKVDQQPKCWRCNRLLAEFVARPWKFICPRCKATNNSPKD